MNRSEIEEVLRHPLDHEWTVQGFGMLRTYFGDETRLQVWDQRLAVFNASPIHDHPWDFESTIIAGHLINQRYLTYPIWPTLSQYRVANEVLIRPGEGGGPLEERHLIQVKAEPIEIYGVGESYTQQAAELHQTRYSQGTVTVIERERVTDQDVARTIWFGGGDWVSAVPRPAAKGEIRAVCQTALATWFDL